MAATAAIIAALAALPVSAIASAPPGEMAEADVASVPVSFAVENVNRTPLACSSDGKSYVLAGRLVGPRKALLQTGGSVPATLYLHELNFAKFFWSFGQRPEYDYAAEVAKRGAVSAVIDRLGYGESPHPDGNDVCIGSHADMAHQVIEQLRAGSYSANGIAPRAFERVALAGHSVGGQIAELESYTFADADALMLFAWADQSYSNRGIQETTKQSSVCASGGEPWKEGGSDGYAYMAQNDADFRSLYFDTTPEDVIATVAALRQRDPCGDVDSGTPGILLNNSRVDEIEVPVLLQYGLTDAVFQQPTAGQRQAALFTGSDDVTLEFYERTAHALAFEQSIPQIRETTTYWLAERDLTYTPPRRCADSKRIVLGTRGADTLAGSQRADGLIGLAGDDGLRAKQGPDCLVGGAGQDVLRAGAGGDRIDATDGGPDTVHCGPGDDRVQADPQDTLVACGRPR